MTTQTDLRGPSHTLLDGPDRAPARAMLYATGLTDEVIVKDCQWQARIANEQVQDAVCLRSGHAAWCQGVQ